MGQYMKYLLLLLVIVSVSMFEGGKAEIKSRSKVTVKIIDKLSNNQDLTLHCKSKDDDLGEHTIKNGEIYDFSFLPRYIGKTLFFCNFGWPSDTSDHYFDIYDQDRDWCEVCDWQISESGPCNVDGTGKSQCYPWNSKP